VEIYAPVRVEKDRIVPAVTEPQIVWVLGGSAWIEEREIGGRWLRSEVKKDDLFLTAPGPPYEMQWKATGRQPFEIMTTFLLAMALDVTKADQAAAAAKAAVERFGRIEVLVNNAGYALLGALEECAPEELEAQFRTNVFGLVDVTRAVLPTLRA